MIIMCIHVYVNKQDKLHAVVITACACNAYMHACACNAYTYVWKKHAILICM